MKNGIRLLIAIALGTLVYNLGWASAPLISRYFPSCSTFELADGQRFTGWHSYLSTGEHVVQLRSGQYAVFPSYTATRKGEKDVDCDFDYVRPVERRN